LDQKIDRAAISGIVKPSAEERHSRTMAIGMVAASSVILSFGGLIVRNIEHADPWQINFYRSGALCIAISVVLLINYRGAAAERIHQSGFAGLLAGGSMAAAGMCYIQSITHTTVANTMFTLAAIPFITAALAWIFLREKLQPTTFVTMIIAASGIALMVADGIGAGSVYGNLMALVTALFFSIFAIIVRKNRNIDMLPALLVSGLTILLVSFIVRFGQLTISWNDIILCLVWGGLMSGFANWMFIAASRYLAAAELTLFMLLEFALAPIWVWIFVQEAPSYWTIFGGTMVIVAVVGRSLFELRRNRKHLKRGRPSPV